MADGGRSGTTAAAVTRGSGRGEQKLHHFGAAYPVGNKAVKIFIRKIRKFRKIRRHRRRECGRQEAGVCL
jgi:hypothetical protein